LGRAVLSPLDLERENPNLIGGDSLSGSHHLDQNFVFRPAFGWSRHKTPVRNLYLCGASTWRGAGVNAGSGFMLAKMLTGDYDGSRRHADDHIETGARDDGLPPLSRGFAGTPSESRTRNVEHLE
jgi:phytoene dehydrogenase-like protein